MRNCKDSIMTRQAILPSTRVTTCMLLMVIVACCSRFATACNVDVLNIVTFTNNEPGSYFGYSVLQHKNNRGNLILVGAPRGQSSFIPSIDRPGALYRCSGISSRRRLVTCDEVQVDAVDENENSPIDEILEIKDNQWLGVSLTRQANKDEADVTICGHRWKNDFYAQTNPNDENLDRFLSGVCYTLNYEFAPSFTVKLQPCVDEIQVEVANNESYKHYGYCQAGMSATYSMDGKRLILGAVGSYEWNGTTIEAVKQNGGYQYNIGNLSDWGLDSGREAEYMEYVSGTISASARLRVFLPLRITVDAARSLDPATPCAILIGEKGRWPHRDKGYSVSTGNFMSPKTEQGVTGAPRSGSVGKVFIYNLDTFQVHAEMKGEKLSTYYGGAVLGVDLNNDKLSDLLVGAPLYSETMDEGRVYVYMNRGEARMERLGFELVGSNAVGGRFGSSIAFMKDVNLDGFNDVAIAAPYEDENTGAVYIYRGSKDGIQRDYSQRIAARELLPGIQSFGSSLAGGFDIDFNRYPDLIVGAYANDTVYMLRTLPVVNVFAWIEVEPETLDPDFNNCILGGQTITCLTVRACFLYTDKISLPKTIKFDYILEADVIKTNMAAKTRFYFDKEGIQSTSVAAEVELIKDKDVCFPHAVYLQPEARDFLTDLQFVLNYNIFKYEVEYPRGDEPTTFAGGLPPVLNDLACSNGTTEKTVPFISDCGSDSICQTDLKVTAGLTIMSGNSFITLGGDSVTYLQIEVQNTGEEAHQSELLVTHPREVVFESLETKMVGCIAGLAACTPANVITCEPRESTNDTAVVFCSLGNPMRSRTKDVLRMRFDIGGMDWGRRRVDFTVKATTVSREENSTKFDNTATASLPVRIVADTAIRGVVKPETLNYFPDNKTTDGETRDKRALLRSALKAAGILDPKGGTVNKAAIGPAFTNIYEVGNQGPGRLPFETVITIQLPWRTADGDWLIYVRNIQLTGKGSCDDTRLLEQQKIQLMEHYLDQSGTLTYTPASNPPSSDQSNREIGCTKAICETITCLVKGPLLSGQVAVISIDAVLWQRTLIDNNMGRVDLVSTASVAVVNTSQPHTQPKDEMPDTIQLKTPVFTEEAPVKPVEAWVIALSTLGGILGLIILILALWKLGFFKRKTVTGDSL